MKIKSNFKFILISTLCFSVTVSHAESYTCYFECPVGSRSNNEQPYYKSSVVTANDITGANAAIYKLHFPQCKVYWQNSSFIVFGDIPEPITTCEPARPKKAGDVVGRDLNIIGAGWTGHVGVSESASNIYEVLNSANNVIQLNSIDKFRKANMTTKSWDHYVEIPFSTYWGAKYKAKDNFVNPILVDNFIKKQLTYKPIYSLLAFNTKVGKDGIECETKNSSGQCIKTRNYIQAVYRCDTFVNEVYKASGNGSILSSYTIFTIPANVYNGVAIDGGGQRGVKK